jgi:hypothetical protein
MQDSFGAVQTEQWSLILQTVVNWIRSGASQLGTFTVWVFESLLYAEYWGAALLKWGLLVLPAFAALLGVWGTTVSLGTLPFRSGRGRFLAALWWGWWDVLRMTLFFWLGLGRFLATLVVWVWGLLKLFVGLFWRALKNLVTSPFAMLDATSRQPGVPWIAFTLLLVWSAIEATIFTFTLRPTMAEVLAGITGYDVNPVMLVLILWVFLFLLIGGSFACIQVLNEAINTRSYGRIGAMVAVELAVALFEVLFLYRELIDAITPWLAQQGWEVGLVGTMLLAFFGWVGVRGMTWFLFGRFGTPALLAILGRQAMEGQLSGGGGSAAAAGEYWRGPISALKAEHEWFKQEALHLVELLTLPILQLLAAGFNFGVIVILGRPHFSLPFRSLDQVLTSASFVASAKTAEGGAS